MGRSLSKRIHNCRELLQLDRSRRYEQTDYFKPKGFWYGFDDSWQKWCECEQPDWIRRYFYELKLNGSNLLILKTKADMLRFNQEYGGRPILPSMKLIKQVEWTRIAREYDGIEIPVYFWEFRMHPEFMWYYGWDCASGVIWNLEKVHINEFQFDKLPAPEDSKKPEVE